MTKDQSWNLTGLGKAALAIGVASMFVFALAAPAMAGPPTGDFAVFAQCPMGGANPELCVFAQSKAGELVIGAKTVPINKTITLQGGIENGEFTEAANGETLSKTPLAVPGGLLGQKAPTWWPKSLQEEFNKSIEEGHTSLTLTIELVNTPSISLDNLLSEAGVALSLPVRLHLESAAFGSGCYIGSKAHPITLNLTTGTTSPPAPNQPISGALGDLSLLDNDELLLIENDKLVDNAFAAPAAEGCGGLFSIDVDPFVESMFGIPAAAGHNTAVLEGTVEIATVGGVQASQ